MHLDRISIKYRWTIIGLSIAITFASLIFIGKLRINADIESYLPDHIQSKINYDSIESVFGNREPLILVVEASDILSKKTFTNLWKLNNELNQHEDFDRVISLFESNRITGEDGNMIVEPLVDFVPTNKYEFDSLKSKIRKDDNFYGRIISKDFTKILFILNVNSSKSERQIIKSLTQKIEENLTDERYYISGPLYMRTEANDNISRDFILLLPMGLLFMIIFLYLSFRQLKGVLLPFSVVIISILFSLAMIELFSWELSIIGILLPVMMIAIANDYGIHFITKYQELSVTYKNETENLIIMKVTNYLQKPILLTGITTIIGILGLSVHVLIPAKQMGLIAAMGISP